MTATAATVSLMAQDVTGQKKMKVGAVPGATTVRELVQSVLTRMRLVREDLEGRPLEYRARLEREGRHLNDSELVGDALKPEDEITLQPKINAG